MPLVELSEVTDYLRRRTSPSLHNDPHILATDWAAQLLEEHFTDKE